jgi:hypothetical protein
VTCSLDARLRARTVALLQAAKLDRMTVGAKIAGLRVQLQSEENRPIVTVADFRRYRGNAKRVVIFAGVVAPFASKLLSFPASLSCCTLA